MIWLLSAEGAICILLFGMAHFRVHGLSLDKSVRPADILTIIVNLSIAIVIQHYLARRGFRSKGENDFFSSRIDDIEEELRRVHGFFMSIAGRPLRKEETDVIEVSIERQTVLVGALEEAIPLSHCKHLDPHARLVSSAFLAYKAVLTGGNFPTTTYSGFDQTDAERCRAKYAKELCTLRFAILKE